MDMMAGSFGSGERARKITDEPQLIERPEHPAIIELAAYLDSVRGDKEMPDRADIQPSEIARLLPNMIIAEAVDGGADFRVRLFGTALVTLLGEERTGKLLSEFAEEGTAYSSENPEAVQQRWLFVTQRAFYSRKPVFLKVPFAASDRLYMMGHCLSAPLTAGGSEPAQTIGALFVTRVDDD